MSKLKNGYWWVVYKDFNSLSIVRIRTFREGTNQEYQLLTDGEWECQKDEFHKYRFIKHIEEPVWPYDD